MKRIGDGGWQITVEKGVADILNEAGVKPEEVESIICRYESLGDENASITEGCFIVTGTVSRYWSPFFLFRMMLYLGP